jgi:hypothetical protein
MVELQQQSATKIEDNLAIDNTQMMPPPDFLADRDGLVELQAVDSDRFVKFYLDGIRQYARLNQSGADLLEFVCAID